MSRRPSPLEHSNENDHKKEFRKKQLEEYKKDRDNIKFDFLGFIGIILLGISFLLSVTYMYEDDYVPSIVFFFTVIAFYLIVKSDTSDKYQLEDSQKSMIVAQAQTRILENKLKKKRGKE